MVKLNGADLRFILDQILIAEANSEAYTPTPQPLRALGLVPDLGVLQRGVDFVQPQCLAVVVKDTPEANPAGP